MRPEVGHFASFYLFARYGDMAEFLICCRWCHRTGPDVPRDLIQLPSQLTMIALDEGWSLEDEDWICPACIDRRGNARVN